jgi:putative heme-binding domain-containing protein
MLTALTATADNQPPAAWQLQAMAAFVEAADEAKLDVNREKVDAMIAVARKSVGDAAAPLTSRAAAVPLLARDPKARADDLTALGKLLSPQSPAELQAAAITTLARRRDKETAQILLKNWKAYTPALRGAALDGLLTRPDRAALLLDAIESKSIAATDVDAARRQRLLQYPDKPTRTRAEALFAASVNPDRQKVLDAFAAAATLNGDAKKGQLIFAKTCATCHRLGDAGHAVGPDLASVGDKSPQGLLVAILDPNRVVEPRFVNYLATTVDDQTHTGILAGETATSITLIGPDAQQVEIRRQDLKGLRSSNTSLMPEGLEAGLTAQDLADLIAHVRSVR